MGHRLVHLARPHSWHRQTRKRALATSISRRTCTARNWLWLALLAGTSVSCFAESCKKNAHMDAVGGMARRRFAEHLGTRDSHETLHLLAILNQANLNGSPGSELEHLGRRCRPGDRQRHTMQKSRLRWLLPGTTQRRRVALSSCFKFHRNPCELHPLSLLL